MEQWKIIEDNPDYLVSNMGRVKSFKFGREKILKPIQCNGYLKVNLYKNNNKKQHFIHKLVGFHFQEICGNWFDGCETDHINTISTDNRAENLKNCTPKENHNNPLTKLHQSVSRKGKPSWGLGKKYSKEHRENISKSLKGKHTLTNNPNSKAILQFDKDMNFIKWWDCITSAVNELNISQPSISNCCRGKRKTANGYKWGYVADYEKIPFKVFNLEIYKKKVA